MMFRRRALVCQECRWCRLRSQQPAEADYYCEARARLIDRAELNHRCCDKFAPWRGPAER